MLSRHKCLTKKIKIKSKRLEDVESYPEIKKSLEILSKLEHLPNSGITHFCFTLKRIFFPSEPIISTTCHPSSSVDAGNDQISRSALMSETLISLSLISLHYNHHCSGRCDLSDIGLIEPSDLL